MILKKQLEEQKNILEQILTAVNENKKLKEIVDKLRKHQSKCKERWCFCKSENFKEILGEDKK